MNVAFVLPICIRENNENSILDLNTIITCLESIKSCKDYLLVIYNEGRLDKSEIKGLLSNYSINYDIIRDEKNKNISIIRQKCFDHIYLNYPEIKYLGELNMRMIAYTDWYKPLIEFLNNNSNEPMISPAIVDKYGNYSMNKENKINLSNNIDETMKILKNLQVENVIDGMSYPIIHNSVILDEILRYYRSSCKNINNGYNIFNILIGYYNYLGIIKKWRPKIYGMSTIFNDIDILKDKENIEFNNKDIINLYGNYGIEVLNYIFNVNKRP